VFVDGEVTNTLELEAIVGFGVGVEVPHAAIRSLDERVWVHELGEVTLLLASFVDDVLNGEEHLVLVDVAWEGVLLGDPMDHTFDLLLGAVDCLDLHLDDLALSLDDVDKLDPWAIPQQHNLVWHQGVEALLDLLGEIFHLDVDILGQGVNLAAPSLIRWEQWCLNLGLGHLIEIHDLEKDRLADTERAWCITVQLLTRMVLKELIARQSLIAVPGDADMLTETVDDGWGVATSTQALDRVKPWIVPPCDELIVDELLNLTL